MLQRYPLRVALAATAVVVLSACADAPPTAPADDESPSLARSSQAQTAALYERAWPEVLALPGTVFSDHDEVNGKMVFGVENAGAARGVERALAAMRVPAATYEVRVTEPIIQMATLRDRWRPTQGGIQIHFGQYVCTMGFNVDHTGGRSFITNSHCTNKQGGTEGTEYYQPTSTVDPTVIATEAADPAYFRNVSPCPRGRLCRWSDASRALYSSSVTSSRGVISKTSAPNNMSLEVTGTFSITSQNNSQSNFSNGTVLNKVGRTTGWTQGSVSATCVHTNVSGSNITQLCQTFVSNSSSVVVQGGDSGSPVFSGTSTVKLEGILWGGSSSGNQFVFSPLNQVQQELGSFNAVQ